MHIHIHTYIDIHKLLWQLYNNKNTIIAYRRHFQSKDSYLQIYYFLYDQFSLKSIHMSNFILNEVISVKTMAIVVKKNKKLCKVKNIQCIPLILVLGRQRQVNLCEFMASQGYFVRLVSKRKREKEKA